MFEGITAAVGGVVIAVLQFLKGRGGTVSTIRELIDLHGVLPDDAVSKGPLLRHIDSRVEGLIRVETSHSRDWSGIAIASVLLLLGGYSTYWGWTRGLAWLPVTVVGILLTLVGATGLSVSVGKRERDSKGNVIQEGSTRSSTRGGRDET